MSHSSTGLFKSPGQDPLYRVLGDLYTFKATGARTEQTYALVEIQFQPQSGTPLHRHTHEAESFYVLEGTVEAQLGETTQIATPGTFLYLPKGEWHRIANPNDVPARVLCWVTPAGAEHFFMDIGEPVSTSESAPSQPIDLDFVLQTAARYGIEIAPPPDSTA